MMQTTEQVEPVVDEPVQNNADDVQKDVPSKYKAQAEKRRIIKEENKKVVQEFKEQQLNAKKNEKDEKKRLELEQLREETRQRKIMKMKLINEKRNKAITKQLKPVFQTLRGVQKMKEKFRQQFKNQDIVDFLKQNQDILFQQSGMEQADLSNLLQE